MTFSDSDGNSCEDEGKADFADQIPAAAEAGVTPRVESPLQTSHFGVASSVIGSFRRRLDPSFLLFFGKTAKSTDSTSLQGRRFCGEAVHWFQESIDQNGSAAEKMFEKAEEEGHVIDPEIISKLYKDR